MMKKNLVILIILVGVFLVANAYAVQSFCCEQTTSGAYCQNAPQDKCDTSSGLLAEPTSCEATSYCKLGTCYDSQEGTCLENVPQVTCEEKNGGVWNEKPADELPQCQLGCCVTGDGASFVTQSRCKRIASIYGLNTNFRTDISSETECILSVGGEEEGACVFNREYEKTCQRTTKTECNNLKSSSENSNVVFYEDYLCSDENLGTNCGPTERTTCVEGEDAVYFLDSCGNIANVYDSSKINNKIYWSKILDLSASCNPTSSNANSKNCGNCDYYRGSTCKAYVRGEDAQPDYGDYVCRDLSCEYDTNGNGEIDDDEHYQHGESWCSPLGTVNDIYDEPGNGTYNLQTIFEAGEVVNGGQTFYGRPFNYISQGGVPNNTMNLPGARYTRLICYDGEVTSEPCADYRQEICTYTEINTYKYSRCIANKWQGCYDKPTEEDCLDESMDCRWVQGSGSRIYGLMNATKDYMEGDGAPVPEGYCVPLIAPGFDFWENSAQGEQYCSLGSVQCKYEITKDIGDVISGDREVSIGSECINKDGSPRKSWIEARQQMCMAIGDCGEKKNFLGMDGEDKDFIVKFMNGDTPVVYDDEELHD